MCEYSRKFRITSYCTLHRPSLTVIRLLFLSLTVRSRDPLVSSTRRTPISGAFFTVTTTCCCFLLLVVTEVVSADVPPDGVLAVEVENLLGGGACLKTE